jgi:hypothetical protein
MPIRYCLAAVVSCLWFVAAHADDQIAIEHGPPQSPRLASLLDALDRHEQSALDTQSLVSWTIDGIRYEHFFDPLNPMVFPDTYAPLSYCVGPEARPIPYLEKQVGVPSGSMEKFEIFSEFLGGKRAVTMYTPAGYNNSSGPRAFVLVFDAENYINTVGMPTMLDNMIARSVVSPVVVAFLHTPETRNEDLLPNAKFQAFIASELMPWIRKKYRIYELQSEGQFPMRVKINARAVGWVEHEVQVWLSGRVAKNNPLRTHGSRA